MTISITRRAALTAIAAASAVAKVAVDDLNEDELALLALSARDFSGTKTSYDPETMRTYWEIDPTRYPLLDRDSEPRKILESLERRGLVELHDAHVVLPNGAEVNQYYSATDRGRAALAAHRT